MNSGTMFHIIIKSVLERQSACFQQLRYVQLIAVASVFWCILWPSHKIFPRWIRQYKAGTAYAIS